MESDVTQKKNFVESLCGDAIRIYKDWQGQPGCWLLVARDRSLLVDMLWKLWSENITPYPPEGQHEHRLIVHYPLFGFWRSILRFEDYFEHLDEQYDDLDIGDLDDEEPFHGFDGEAA